MASTDTRLLPPEARLLLATAGGSDQDAQIAALARESIDWTRFLQLAALERAEAVVAGRFARVGVTPPPEVARQLKALALRSDVRMATVSHRLDRTLQALQAAGIEVMLLKGAALGRTVYGSLARRPMLDLDLLVHPEQVRPAWETALGLGWVNSEGERASDHYTGHFHQAPLTDGAGFGFNLELHTALFVEGHPFEWPLAEVWRRSRPLTQGPARVPAPEDLLLHVALHFSWSHMARGGAWRAFRDVQVLAESGAVDWPSFTSLASASGGGPAVHWTLRLARRFGVSAVPLEVEEALRPAGLGTLRARALERHLAGGWYLLDAPCPSVRLERALWKHAMGPLGQRDDRAMPWAREPVFPEVWSVDPVATQPGRLLRHLSNAGSYARYLRRVLLGAPARHAANLTSS